MLIDIVASLKEICTFSIVTLACNIKSPTWLANSFMAQLVLNTVERHAIARAWSLWAQDQQFCKSVLQKHVHQLFFFFFLIIGMAVVSCPFSQWTLTKANYCIGSHVSWTKRKQSKVEFLKSSQKEFAWPTLTMVELRTAVQSVFSLQGSLEGSKHQCVPIFFPWGIRVMAETGWQRRNWCLIESRASLFCCGEALLKVLRSVSSSFLSMCPPSGLVQQASQRQRVACCWIADCYSDHFWLTEYHMHSL